MTEVTSNKAPTYPCLTYLEYSRLPPKLQDDYLNCCQAQFERERARILFERQGGLKGSAKRKAQQEVDWFKRTTTWSYLHAYIPLKRNDRLLTSQEMFNRVGSY
ncbi:hypothetical protein HG536_0C03900 [Torulaspora globosa]|uniref:Uncharacterized protein n=1 Tax=Torulaspora globosa TaxID=48254 RepID=A0A7G3ZFD5_9SACH|nr:uncharacterized protein HG536_0C03900 [Torulaspora globosa]QLL32221.1 hypothetical protein HG536_0C03900 [Torulaspora globosa]